MSKQRALIADLPCGVGVRKTKNSAGSEYFRVALGKKFTGRTGPAITRNFRILSDARKWIFGEAQKSKSVAPPVVELESTVRDSAFSMLPAEWNEAAAAVRRCKENGIDLTSVVEAGIRILRPSGGTRSFSEVAKLSQELALSEKKSGSHLQHMRIVAKRFGQEFGEDPISLVTHDAVREWLIEEFDEPNTRRYYARYLHIFFAEAHRRKWLVENPLTHIPRASIPVGDVEFLSTADVKKLLKQARTDSDVLLVGVAIKAFAGLRTSELISLQWRDVSLKQIHVRAVTAKTRQARAVTVCPALASFLRHCQGELDARVIPHSRRHWHALVATLAAAAKVTLPHNGLRHGFGTYHYHEHKNENLTAAEMGNTPDTVIRWYRAPIVEKSAIATFWKIRLRSL